MPKTVKGDAGRKPPEPSAKHADIDAWIKTLMPHMKPIVKGLDKSIRAAVPDLQYAVKYKRAFYGRSELGWIIELAAYDVSVNVLFFGGADFQPRRHWEVLAGLATRKSPASMMRSDLSCATG
jgi:hypothetical protein